MSARRQALHPARLPRLVGGVTEPGGSWRALGSRGGRWSAVALPDSSRRCRAEGVSYDNLERPRTLVEVLASAAQHTGVRPPWQHWSVPFTTGDEHAALHYLKAEGRGDHGRAR